MSSTRTDAPRLIRIAALACTVVAVVSIWLAYAPQIDAIQTRIDDGRSELRSDETAFSQANVLRAERARLADRYATLLAQNPEAVFVRELATTVKRHRVALLGTNVTQDAATNDADGANVPFSRTRVSIEMRGTYRGLLATIADLSTGSEIVEVREPNLHRDGDAIAATVPVIIYEPLPTVALRNARTGTNR